MPSKRSRWAGYLVASRVQQDGPGKFITVYPSMQLFSRSGADRELARLASMNGYTLMREFGISLSRSFDLTRRIVDPELLRLRLHAILVTKKEYADLLQDQFENELIELGKIVQ